MSKTQFIDNNGGSPMVYDSILLSPEKMKVLGSKLAIKIIKELSDEPGCTMDLSRKLGIHEQKIYYHMRNLEKAGIIKQIGTEMRYGMTAKIYEVVAPVVATKLSNNGVKLTTPNSFHDSEMIKFLDPFIKDGKLNALIVIGDPYSHGRFDAISREGPHTFDLGLFMGKFSDKIKFPCHKLDTELGEDDLKQNLILIGNPKTNSIIDKINDKLPIFFDEKNDFSIISKNTGNVYDDPRIGVIIKMNNPFSEDKKILLLGGRTRGTRAAIITLTEHIESITSDNGGDTSKIIRGFDKNNDKIIDDIEVLE